MSFVRTTFAAAAVAISFTLTPAPSALAHEVCPERSSEQFEALVYVTVASLLAVELDKAVQDPTTSHFNWVTQGQAEAVLLRLEEEWGQWADTALAALSDQTLGPEEGLMQLLESCVEKVFHEIEVNNPHFKVNHHLEVMVYRTLELAGNRKATAELDQYFIQFESTRCRRYPANMLVSTARFAELFSEDLVTLFIKLQESSGEEEEGALRKTWEAMRVAAEEAGLFEVRTLNTLGLPELWPDTIGRNYNLGHALAFDLLRALRRGHLSPLNCAKESADFPTSLKVAREQGSSELALEYGELRYERYKDALRRLQQEVDQAALE